MPHLNYTKHGPSVQVLNSSICKNAATNSPKNNPCKRGAVCYDHSKLTNKGDKMKYMKRANIYKASNVSFNAETHEAVSYDWWTFVKRINGALVFNNHGYSNSTRKHQSKVRTLLHKLGLEVDLVVNVPGGLQRDTWPDQARQSIQSKIDAVMSQLNNTRRRKSLDAERIQVLNTLHKEKQTLETFLASMN